MLRLLIAGFALLALATSPSAAVLEVPQNGGDASGIGYISGWKCPPNDNVQVVIDGGAPRVMSTGIVRGDTAQACNNGGRNGFITQINFNLLGFGTHTAVVQQNGIPFAQSTFHVVTFGTNFLTGKSGEYVLANFPNAGKSTTVTWSQGAQNFIITGTSSGPIATPTPKPPTAAQVRYGNNLICGGAGFTSTLTAGRFSWISFSGTYSDYLGVDEAKIGPFTATLGNCGTTTYPAQFNLLPGRRYALVQDLQNGNPVLRQLDEGSALAADAQGSAESTEIVTVIGTVDHAGDLEVAP